MPRVKARLLVPAAVLILAAAALSACGGGGDSGAEDEITATIVHAATKSDPKNCAEYETLSFTEQNFQTKGKASTEACEKEARSGQTEAKGAKVSKISVNDEKATAQVKFEGGSLDSQTVEVSLVEEGGKWKLDKIDKFADFDGKVLGEVFLKQFEEEPQLTPTQAKCIAGKVGEASQAEAEELFFSGSAKKIIELAQGCA